MADTNIPDGFRDLLDAPVATLVTNGPDGYPQATVIWFLADGDEIKLSLNTDRQKVKNLQKDPAVAFVIVDAANPMRYLEVRGDARIEDDPDYVFADRVGAKYGADLRAFDGPDAGRVVVTLDPVRVRPVDMSAG